MYYIEQKREAFSKKREQATGFLKMGLEKKSIRQEDKIYQIIIYLVRRVGEKRKINFLIEKRYQNEIGHTLRGEFCRGEGEIELDKKNRPK